MMSQFLDQGRARVIHASRAAGISLRNEKSPVVGIANHHLGSALAAAVYNLLNLESVGFHEPDDLAGAIRVDVDLQITPLVEVLVVDISVGGLVRTGLPQDDRAAGAPEDALERAVVVVDIRQH